MADVAKPSEIELLETWRHQIYKLALPQWINGKLHFLRLYQLPDFIEQTRELCELANRHGVDQKALFVILEIYNLWDVHGTTNCDLSEVQAAEALSVWERVRCKVHSASSEAHRDDEAEATKPTRPASKSTQRAEWLAMAMLLVRDHPDWSNAKIAKEVGKDKSTLSRSREYQAAAAMARRASGIEGISRSILNQVCGT